MDILHRHFSLMFLLFLLPFISSCSQTENSSQAISDVMNFKNFGLYLDAGDKEYFILDDNAIYSYDGAEQLLVQSGALNKLTLFEDSLLYFGADEYVHKYNLDNGIDSILDPKGCHGFTVFNGEVYYRGTEIYKIVNDEKEIIYDGSTRDVFPTEEKLFFLNSDHELYQLDVSGEVSYVASLQPQTWNFLVYENSIYYCTNTEVFSLNLETGEERLLWQGTVFEKTLNIMQHELLFSTLSSGTVALNLETGKIRKVAKITVGVIYVGNSKVLGTYYDNRKFLILDE